MKEITLKNGVKIPAIGFGTYKSTEFKEEEVLKEAIKAGYRHFDTASFYENESQIGKVLKESGIPRSDFFITSKLWLNEMGYEEAKQAFVASCKRLRTDTIDLYLIHWPCLDGNPENWKEIDIETWKALEELYEEGKVKAIGVSNFLAHHLENLLKNCKIVPMVDQIEFHPGYTQPETREFCKKHGIQVEAWSPLGRGAVLHDEYLLSVAKKYGVSVGQVCLRFILQCGGIPLPKASSMERMKQNQDVFDFELLAEDMEGILSMPEKGFSGYYPDKRT